jgi:hypothetical protein
MLKYEMTKCLFSFWVLFPAYIGAGTFLVATGFIPCTQREIAVVFLCLAVLSTGFMSGGYYANHIDLAPK